MALYYIKNGLTDRDVIVSLDGAHVKTGDKMNFDIWSFLNENGFVKCAGDTDKWQGTYGIDGLKPHIIISSKPGEGDVVVWLEDGKKLFVESKKSGSSKSGQAYPLMREAIGQLMTGRELTENIVPAVAVPYSEKSVELATRWSKYSQVKQIGIRFVLVKADGDIVMI